jgi:hypothetical protein
MQIETKNKLFTGTDGLGDHARVLVVDNDIRMALFGIDNKHDIVLLTEESVRGLLGIETREEFDKRLKQLLTTEAEKKMIVELAKTVGASEAAAWKIEAIEVASGHTLIVDTPPLKQD